jgi:hypothetical protein
LQLPIFNPILVELTSPNATARERVMVISGAVHPSEESVQNSVGVRLNDSGFADLEDSVASFAPDLSGLVPAEPIFDDDICVPTAVGETCAHVQLIVSNDPPPSFSGIVVDIDSQTDFVTMTLGLNDVIVQMVANITVGAAMSMCQINVNAPVLGITGAFAIEPDVSDATKIDVEQQGDVDVSLASLQLTAACSGLVGRVIQDAINTLTPGAFETAIERRLNATDANGDTTLELALQQAFGDLLAGQEGLGLTAQTTYAQITEDPEGITIVTHRLITADIGTAPGQCMPSLDTPLLPGSLLVPGALPSLGTSTPPPSALPYDFGTVLSKTGLNQLTKAVVECGLLDADITEIGSDASAMPLTAGFLATLLPAFQAVDPATPLVIKVRPTLAPVFPEAPEPASEFIELQAAQIIVEILDPAGNTLYLKAAVDIAAGLRIVFNLETGQPELGISETTAIEIVTLDNPIGVDLENPATLQTLQSLLIEVITDTLSSLTDALGGTVSLPAIGDINADVEVEQPEGYLSLFTNLAPLAAAPLRAQE